MVLTQNAVGVYGYQIPDYSGAAQAMGALGAQPYQMVSGIIGQAQDYAKQQKDQAKSVDTASRIAGLIASKAPDLIPGIGELKGILDDQENPLSRRVDAAAQLFDLMKVGYEVKDYNNKNRLLEMQMQKASAAQSEANVNENSQGLKF